METVSEYIQRFVDANILHLSEARLVLLELEENREGLNSMGPFWYATDYRKEVIRDAIDQVLGKYEGYAQDALSMHLRNTIQGLNHSHRGSEDTWCPRGNPYGNRQLHFFGPNEDVPPVQTERADI